MERADTHRRGNRRPAQQLVACLLLLSTAAIVDAGDNPSAESLIGVGAGDGAGVVIAIVGESIDVNHIDFGGQGDPLSVGNRLPYAEGSGPGNPTEATGAASLILQLLPNARIVFIY